MAFPARFRVPLLTVLLMLLMVALRVVYGGVAELRRGEEALENAKRDSAIVHFERALHWYYPFSPTVDAALEQLLAIGRGAEADGEAGLALEAYEAIRSGCYATRSFYLPNAEWVAMANERIAALQVADAEGAWPDPSLEPEARKKIALELLERDNSPSAVYSALAVLGFLTWVVAGLGFFTRAFDPDGRFDGGSGLKWGLGIVAGYVVWIIGLLYA